jgi:tetratricopeptide (TPR) repeat protein
MFILLSLATKTRKTVLNLTATPVSTPEATTGGKYSSRFPAILISLPFIIAVLAFFFYASRALAAEIKFKKSLDALVANQGTQTYDLMREAINTNPFVDRYHASYSLVNLILANSIAQNENITDQDRDTIAQLIQQAIREAKAVVTLNPQRAGNWELLASTYRAIIPFAEGADQFAVQTYNQSIVLDPINPNLRIALGGLHYALGDYDTAIRVFELATFTKPDHANAHYNLAVAYREKGDIQKSVNEITLVLSLVDRNSDDYELVRTELENLEKRLPAETAEGTETLTPPQPAEEPVIQPPLELPEEAEPPAAPEVSPTPTPSE